MLQGPLPSEQFLIQGVDLERAKGESIELLRMGAVGPFDVAREFGRARRQDEKPNAAPLASSLKIGGKLTATGVSRWPPTQLNLFRGANFELG